jgi:hypothetical protein
MSTMIGSTSLVWLLLLTAMRLQEVSAKPSLHRTGGDLYAGLLAKLLEEPQQPPTLLAAATLTHNDDDGRGKSSSGTRNHNQRQVQATPGCGEVLATLSKDDAIALVKLALYTNATAFVIDFVLAPIMDYGIKVIKVCGACSDFESIQDCGDNVYGGNQTHSGLLFLPLETSDLSVKKGTSLVQILCHGTRASATEVPSNEWSSTSPDKEIILAMIFTSLSGAVGIMPDYMGYGESRLQNITTGLYRAYLVRQSYLTATLPLIYQAQVVIQNQSDCQSALSEYVVVSGYSEGGYAAAALGVDLDRLGWNVVSVRVGGAPLKLSTEQLVTSVERSRAGTFPTTRRYYIALVASAFSSTYETLANYQMNQDMLNASIRDELVNVIHSGAGKDEINALVNETDPLSVISSLLQDRIDAALARGEREPCVTSAVVNETDLLCQALQAQDLASAVEAATYPVALCHSPDDSVVYYSNLPNLSNNSLLTLVPASGEHTEASLDCYLDTMLFFISNAFDNITIADTTRANCSATGTGNPTVSPAQEQGPTPAQEQGPTPAPRTKTQPTSATGITTTTASPAQEQGPTPAPRTMTQPTIAKTSRSSSSWNPILTLTIAVALSLLVSPF